MSQTVTIDIPSASWLTSNDRPHWAVKAKRVAAIRKLAGFATLARIRSGNLTPMQHADLTVHVYYPANRGQDAQNAADAAKGAIDGVVDGGLLPNDDNAHLISTKYTLGGYTGKPGWYRLRLEFTPTTNERQQ